MYVNFLFSRLIIKVRIQEKKTTNKTVKRVAMHLGTVDAGRHKSDANQVILEVSSAIIEVHKRFAKAEIAFSSHLVSIL